MAATGSLTPVLECTHVSATARVFGRSARISELTISSTVARSAVR
jgi:hypothetical protein